MENCVDVKVFDDVMVEVHWLPQLVKVLVKWTVDVVLFVVVVVFVLVTGEHSLVPVLESTSSKIQCM